MKHLDLNVLDVQEMKITEMRKFNGGSIAAWLSDFWREFVELRGKQEQAVDPLWNVAPTCDRLSYNKLVFF